MIYQGSCHCGQITFEVQAEDHLQAVDCNCSICAKSGYLHLIVPNSNFKLLSGQDQLTTYTFNTGIAKHTFCKHCGIKPFYTPRSNPDGLDVNVRCLDPIPNDMTVTQFDGKHWEEHARTLAHKSLDT